MPYIKKENRKKYDSIIEDIVDTLTEHGFENPNPGEINYIISSIIWKLFDKNISYTNGNTLIGVLESVKHEFIRRKLNDYENKKIKENGDLY
jgi:hypothetical protein